MSLYETLWSTGTRKMITALATSAVTILGVITGAPPALEAWDDMGLPTMATRAWTRTRLADYKGIRMDIAVGKKEAAEGRLDQLELDYLKAMNEEQKVLNLQAQRRQKDTIEKLKEQIKAIEQTK